MSTLFKVANRLTLKYAQPMIEYKFRAETSVDVEHFLRIAKRAGINVSNVRIEPQTIKLKNEEVPIPDVEVTFSSDAMLGTLKHILALVPDGHVMHQTISEASSYSGERTYEPSPKLD
jgi:hypothetical protein